LALALSAAAPGAGQSESPDDLVVDRGTDRHPLVIPANESLQFDVMLNLAVIGDTRVGKFTLSAGVEGYLPGLPRPGEAVDAVTTKTGWIKGEASGDYLGYTLDHKIEARLLPQAWPQVVYRDVQRGSENRMRELRYGTKDGAPTGWYRADAHCHGCDRREHFLAGNWFRDERHCKKCKRGEHRQWREPETRSIPSGAVDMLSALFMSRTLIRDGLDEIHFPLVTKNEVWNVTLQRGTKQNVTVKSGTYACRLVNLIPRLPEGDEGNEIFKGLFGIHGTLGIWLHETTGVPVKIEGIVPLGPFDLDVALELRTPTGTPPDFKAVDAK